MKPGQVIAVHLKQGVTITRVLDTGGSDVAISLGRNKQAHIPLARLLMETDSAVSAETEVEALREQVRAIASGIGLEELWRLLQGEGRPFGIDELAELYWGRRPDTAHKLALLVHLEEATIYFARGDAGYVARTQEDIDETRAKQRRQEEKAAAASSLMDALAGGSLPSPLTEAQRPLLAHLRGFAVHGDSYARSELAKELLAYLGPIIRDPQRHTFEVLEAAGVLSLDEPLELERYGIPTEFPKGVLEEASSTSLAPLLEDARRRDLTGLAAFTIDDVTTLDRDDALSIETTSEGWQVGIHIADAGALIAPGSAVDREADRRMATLYLPERRVGMVPPVLDEQAGSLVPGESRACLSLLVRVNEAGQVVKREVVPSVVRSRTALSYDEVDGALGDPGHPWHAALSALKAVAGRLRAGREQAGAVSFERPEMSVRVTDGTIAVRVVSRTSPSRMLVTEFMVLCNALLAGFCIEHGLPAAFRSQHAFSSVDLDGRPVVPPGTPEGPYKQYLMMRRLPPAELSTTPAAHGGLGVKAYIQASSPLRRYPDLVMQRQVSHFLSKGTPMYPTDAVASVAQRAEVQLKELAGVEEERKRYWFLKYLTRERLADASLERRDFQAVVLDTERSGPALLELVEYPFRVKAELAAACRPGETVTLRLHGVALWRKVGQFIQVLNPKQAS
jgi:exoribonuclease-2